MALIVRHQHRKGLVLAIGWHLVGRDLGQEPLGVLRRLLGTGVFGSLVSRTVRPSWTSKK